MHLTSPEQFQVTGVPDGEAAVIAAEKTPFDLLLLDCHMPREFIPTIVRLCR